MIPYQVLLQAALPECLVVLTTILVLICDLFVLRGADVRIRFRVASLLGALGCCAAIGWLLLSPPQIGLEGGALLNTPSAHLVQIVLLVFSVLILLLSATASFTEHAGEFVLLVLLATTGMMFLVATQNILVLFLSLELLSLSLYVLSALDKRSARAAEAALKYFLFGGMSAAFLLFGFSLLYGLTNTTDLVQMATALQGQSISPLLGLALATTVIGLGFKIAAAPFHFWAPDIYEAAPVPAATFIATSSKIASFYLFFEVMTVGLGTASGSAAWKHFIPGWVPLLACVAAISMLFGNLAALRQKSLRRLLAYSAVAHAGYMLLAIVSHTQQSLSALLYYVITYALATLGIFAVIANLETMGISGTLDSLRGLSRRAPVLSACLFVFLLSLAGIPPLAGFFGKFYLFAAALHSTADTTALLWLVGLAIATSAVSLYYYLQVLKRVYVLDPPEDRASLKPSIWGQTIAVAMAALVLLFGCAPNLLLQWIQAAIGA